MECDEFATLSLRLRRSTENENHAQCFTSNPKRSSESLQYRTNVLRCTLYIHVYIYTYNCWNKSAGVRVLSLSISLYLFLLSMTIASISEGYSEARGTMCASSRLLDTTAQCAYIRHLMHTHTHTHTLRYYKNRLVLRDPVLTIRVYCAHTASTLTRITCVGRGMIFPFLFMNIIFWVTRVHRIRSSSLCFHSFQCDFLFVSSRVYECECVCVSFNFLIPFLFSSLAHIQRLYTAISISFDWFIRGGFRIANRLFLCLLCMFLPTTNETT